MYMTPCRCNGATAVSGLGSSDAASALIPIAASLVGGPAAGAAAGALTSGSGSPSGGAMMPQQTTVSPQISTQISPQISPVFQQQFQPQNSAATAGTSQVLPSMPAMMAPDNSGMVPSGVGVPGYAQPNYAPTVPQVPTDWTKYMPYALAGLGIFAFVALKKRGKKAA